MEFRKAHGGGGGFEDGVGYVPPKVEKHDVPGVGKLISAPVPETPEQIAAKDKVKSDAQVQNYTGLAAQVAKREAEFREKGLPLPYDQSQDTTPPPQPKVEKKPFKLSDKFR